MGLRNHVGGSGREVKSAFDQGPQLFVTLGEPHIEDYDRKDGTKGTSLRARLNELEFAGEPKTKTEPVENYDSTGLISDIPF